MNLRSTIVLSVLSLISTINFTADAQVDEGLKEIVKEYPRLSREMTRIETSFVKIAKGNSAPVRTKSAQQLCQCSSEFAKVVCNELEKYFDDENKQVRFEMVYSYGKILARHQQPCPVSYVRLLKDKDEDVRKKVNEILIDTTTFEEGCIPVLSELFESGSDDEKIVLILTLASAGKNDSDVIGLIKEHLASDQTPFGLKYAATRALWRATDDLKLSIPQYVARVNETFEAEDNYDEIFDKEADSRQPDADAGQGENREEANDKTDQGHEHDEHEHDHEGHSHAGDGVAIVGELSHDAQAQTIERFEYDFFEHLSIHRDEFVVELKKFYEESDSENRLGLIRWINTSFQAAATRPMIPRLEDEFENDGFGFVEEFDEEYESNDFAPEIVPIIIDIAQFEDIRFDGLDKLLEQMIVGDDKQVGELAMKANLLLDELKVDD